LEIIRRCQKKIGDLVSDVFLRDVRTGTQEKQFQKEEASINKAQEDYISNNSQDKSARLMVNHLWRISFSGFRI
jgi:hypothetical protein